MNIQEARNNASTAYHALITALSNGEPTDNALATLNSANSAAVALGARECEGTVTIVDGKPFSPSRVSA